MSRKNMSDKPQGVLQSLDWWTMGIYLVLLTFGWISVCGASYTYGDTDIIFSSLSLVAVMTKAVW